MAVSQPLCVHAVYDSSRERLKVVSFTSHVAG